MTKKDPILKSRIISALASLVPEEFQTNFCERAEEYRDFSQFLEAESFDFTRCVRPNGTAYGTAGKCRKGAEKQKEYPFRAAVTQGRFNIPHKGHAKLIQHLLEKAPHVYVILGTGKENVNKDFRSQMLRAVLRNEGVDLSRVHILRGTRAASVIKDLAEKEGKDNVMFMLGEDQKKFLDSMGKSLGVKTDVVPRDSEGASSSAIRRMIDSGDQESLQKEFDNNPYLIRLAQVARKVEKDEFSEFDFARCQRANGTFYGTAGKCRKGKEAEAKPQGKFLGGGLEGKVYDIGRGRVLKVATAGDSNLEAHKLASEAGLAPKALAAGVMKDGRRFQVMEKANAEPIPGIAQPGRASLPLEELSDRDRQREKAAYLAALRLNELGVAHGDIHGGNLQWDKEKDQPVLLDFDNSKVDKKAAIEEARSLLNSVGVRLEGNDMYDEADEVYAAANQSPKKFFESARRAIEENF